MFPCGFFNIIQWTTEEISAGSFHIHLCLDCLWETKARGPILNHRSVLVILAWMAAIVEYRGIQRHRKKVIWEFGTSRGKLLNIRWINNKVLLYSTGKCIQWPIINHHKKIYQKKKKKTSTVNSHGSKIIYLFHMN